MYFQDYFKSFKAKFKEVKDMQDSLEILNLQPNTRKQIEETKSEIDEGTKILNDYITKMDRAIAMIVEKKNDFDVSDLEDTKEKCEKMIQIITKKQAGDVPSRQTTGERMTTNKFGLTREEQKILENWEEQMKEIVD